MIDENTLLCCVRLDGVGPTRVSGCIRFLLADTDETMNSMLKSEDLHSWYISGRSKDISLPFFCLNDERLNRAIVELNMTGKTRIQTEIEDLMDIVYGGDKLCA